MELEVHLHQTAESADAHGDLDSEVAKLMDDTISRWSGVTPNISTKSEASDAPSEETKSSGSGYFCLNTYIDWDWKPGLVEWWMYYMENTDCIDQTAADSNILITNGPGNAPGGWAYGGQYAVVELGPCTNPDWYYDGSCINNDYQFRFAMNAVHEMGHNIKMDHPDGRIDENRDGTGEETPMTNFYGDNAIKEDWEMNCDEAIPSTEPSDWYTQNEFTKCEKDSSYL